MAKSENVLAIFTLLLLGTDVGVVTVCAACDYCQPSNSFACHNETVYSLCIDGIATMDYVNCPSGHVCTGDEYVCYPRSTGAVASCAREVIVPVEPSRCGICGSANKLFSCIDEHTVAFCFGNDFPDYEAIAYCPPDTICDLRNTHEFCTHLTKASPSCRRGELTTTTEDPTTTTTEQPTTTTEEPTTTTTSEEPTTTTTTEEPTTTTTTEEPTTTEQPTTTTTEDPTTTSTTEEPTTTTTTTEEPTMTTTEEPTSTTTTEEPTTTTTTEEPTTITTTEAPTTTTTTTEEPTTTTTTEEPTTTTTTEEPTTTTTTEEPTTTTTTEEPTTTTSKPKTPDEICQEEQKYASFVDPNDTDCTKYVLCYSTTPGHWLALYEKCKKGQLFDPALKACNANYVCPY